MVLFFLTLGDLPPPEQLLQQRVWQLPLQVLPHRQTRQHQQPSSCSEQNQTAASSVRPSIWSERLSDCVVVKERKGGASPSPHSAFLLDPQSSSVQRERSSSSFIHPPTLKFPHLLSCKKKWGIGGGMQAQQSEEASTFAPFWPGEGGRDRGGGKEAKGLLRTEERAIVNTGGSKRGQEEAPLLSFVRWRRREGGNGHAYSAIAAAGGAEVLSAVGGTRIEEGQRRKRGLPLLRQPLPFLPRFSSRRRRRGYGRGRGDAVGGGEEVLDEE